MLNNKKLMMDPLAAASVFTEKLLTFSEVCEDDPHYSYDCRASFSTNCLRTFQKSVWKLRGIVISYAQNEQVQKLNLGHMEKDFGGLKIRGISQTCWPCTKVKDTKPFLLKDQKCNLMVEPQLKANLYLIVLQWRCHVSLNDWQASLCQTYVT